MANEAGQVARILYKELVEGDLRKLQAKSNDADTGGGARDFRFGSYKTLLPVIKQMFPQIVKENRKRGGQIVQIDVFKGPSIGSTQTGLPRTRTPSSSRLLMCDPKKDAFPGCTSTLVLTRAMSRSAWGIEYCFC